MSEGKPSMERTSHALVPESGSSPRLLPFQPKDSQPAVAHRSTKTPNLSPVVARAMRLIVSSSDSEAGVVAAMLDVMQARRAGVPSDDAVKAAAQRLASDWGLS